MTLATRSGLSRTFTGLVAHILDGRREKRRQAIPVGCGAAWADCLAQLGLEESCLISISPFDNFRRIYAFRDKAYKIVMTRYESTSSARVENTRGEFEILKRCNGLPGVPKVHEHIVGDGFEVIVMERLRGTAVSDLRIGWFEFLIIFGKVVATVMRMAKRGVSHNDIVARNIVLSPNRELWLVDFDQASLQGVAASLLRSFLGLSFRGSKMQSSVPGLVLRHLRDRAVGAVPPRVVAALPPSVVRSLKRFLGITGATTLPILAEDADDKARTLLKVWQIAQVSNASSPGQVLAYYSLDYRGYYYPGERPWADRWKVLNGITDYSGKRILELGCNMALLSCSLLKKKQAAAALAIDADEEILKAAQLMANFYQVDAVYRCINLDGEEDWETELSDFEPDIVFALSVLNWVQDKERLIRFFGRFDELIFEGHEPVEIELKRLEEVGFRNIEVVTVTERDRAVLYCRKGPWIERQVQRMY